MNLGKRSIGSSQMALVALAVGASFAAVNSTRRIEDNTGVNATLKIGDGHSKEAAPALAQEVAKGANVATTTAAAAGDKAEKQQQQAGQNLVQADGQKADVRQEDQSQVQQQG